MFRPFSEKILNISNCLSEFIIAILFVLLAIDQLYIPRSFSLIIDDVLVGLLFSIMFIQMLASVLVFARTLTLIMRQKCNKKNSVIPLKIETTSEYISKIDKEK